MTKTEWMKYGEDQKWQIDGCVATNDMWWLKEGKYQYSYAKNGEWHQLTKAQFGENGSSFDGMPLRQKPKTVLLPMSRNEWIAYGENQLWLVHGSIASDDCPSHSMITAPDSDGVRHKYISTDGRWSYVGRRTKLYAEI